MAIDFAELGIKVKSDDLGRLTVELDKVTTAGEKAERATQKLSTTTIAQGASSVAATRGMGAWAAIQAEATGHVGEHSLAIGRLERAFAAIVGHAVGANSAVELLGSGLLKFAVGSLETAGILGGLALLAVAYDKMTEGSRKAKEETDKLIEALGRAIHLKANGPGGETVDQVGAANSQINVLAAERFRLNQGLLERPYANAPPSAVQHLADAQKIARARLEEVETEIQNLRNLKAGGQSIIHEATQAAIEEAHQKELERLRKIAAERDRQLHLLEAYNAWYEKAYGGVLSIAPMSSAQRADWLASEHARTMTDKEHADLVKTLGIGAVPSVSMPNVGLTDGLDEFQKRLAALLDPFDAVREAAVRLAEDLGRGKASVMLGLAQWGISHTGDGTDSKWHFDKTSIKDGAESGAATAVGDALMQFSPQGLAYSAVSSGINYIISGFTDMAASLFSGGQAAREFALQTKTMKDNLDAAVAAFKHDDLAAAYAQVASQTDALTKQAWDTYGTASYIILHGTDDLNKALNAIGKGSQVSAEIVQQHQQYAQEDLNVRLMKATGNVAGADLLAFREQQQREMDAAKIAHATNSLADQLYLNTLKTVQNNELIAYQNGLLATASRNEATGFYGIAAYAGAYATPRGPAGYPTDSGTPASSDLPRASGRPGGGTQTIILQVDGKILTRVVVNNIDQFGSATGGAGTPRSDALNRYPA